MSLARIYTTKGPVRKDGLVCGKCRKPVVKGQDRRRTFAVGFRGYEQTRCMDAACTPTRSELESSAVATVYAAIDDIDFASLDSADALTEARDSVVEALNEVAGEYESNEMYDINEDLQERVSTLEGAASDLEGWEPEGEAPEEDTDCSTCDGSGQVTAYDEDGEEDGEEECEECSGTGQVESDEGSLEDWLSAARESLEAAIDEMELP